MADERVTDFPRLEEVIAAVLEEHASLLKSREWCRCGEWRPNPDIGGPLAVQHREHQAERLAARFEQAGWRSSRRFYGTTDLDAQGVYARQAIPVFRLVGGDQ